MTHVAVKKKKTSGTNDSLRPRELEAYLHMLSLGTPPRKAARLAGRKHSEFNELAEQDNKFHAKRQAALHKAGRVSVRGRQPEVVDEEAVTQFCNLISRNFSEEDAALVLGKSRRSLRSAIEKNANYRLLRARARKSVGLKAKELCINWAIKEVEKHGAQAKWAIWCLCDRFPEMGLQNPFKDPDKINNLGAATAITAAMLSQEVAAFRERMDSSGGDAKFVESRVLPE